MDAIVKLKNAGIIPVVVMEKADDAVPTAKAMLDGGVDVMEITLRTAAGIGAIREVAEQCPGMLVGAGTVISVEQAKAAVAAGAKFVVSPGLDEGVVNFCLEREVAVTPGCVTPTEITRALAMGLRVLKFFPANVYGGLPAMKALAAPFGAVKFIPTGGVSAANLSEYVSAPFVHAVGGSWLCQKSDIAQGNFGAITAMCKEARGIVLGYEFAHLGINAPDQAASLAVCDRFAQAFGFAVKAGASSNFSTGAMEIMNSMYLGQNGHIAIRTNDIARAVADLEKKGFAVDPQTEKRKGDAVIAVYLKDEFGGFAVHLLQK